jgi:small subunit ribosomal protein S20
MANHQSAIKRVRQAETHKVANKYHTKSTRNAIKKLRTTTNKEEAQTLLPKVSAMVDKLAKKNLVHKKKAANLKSGLAKHVNGL